MLRSLPLLDRVNVPSDSLQDSSDAPNIVERVRSSALLVPSTTPLVKWYSKIPWNSSLNSSGIESTSAAPSNLNAKVIALSLGANTVNSVSLSISFVSRPYAWSAAANCVKPNSFTKARSVMLHPGGVEEATSMSMSIPLGSFSSGLGGGSSSAPTMGVNGGANGTLSRTSAMVRGGLGN